MPNIFTASDTSIDKFHFGLNVADLHRSVDFYRLFFGLEPGKFLDDYAKFELREPPLVMSLLPNSQSRGGTLSHLGLRVSDMPTLVDAQRRLEEGGVRTQREEGVECCYARQTKFWVTDPDLNLWEVYVVAGDLDHHGRDAPPVVAAPTIVELAKSVWEHRLTQPLPDRIEHVDGSLDEARLEGTFGRARTDAERALLWSEIWRVLRPGGTVHVHNLVASRRFASGTPELPGPAAVIKYVPVEDEILRDLERAGFQSLRFDKLGDQPCFTFEGVELREMRLSGCKPFGNGFAASRRTVIYRGPFERVTDDAGNVYPRGQAATISEPDWQTLKLRSPAGDFEIV